MSYAIEDFTELFEISRAYYYEMQQRGEGPHVTSDGKGNPRISLKAAMDWAEYRLSKWPLSIGRAMKLPSAGLR
jgi:hypothetical protein